MYLRHLQLGSFRNWDRVDLALRPGPTVIVGGNGEGKTNLVEAVAAMRNQFGGHAMQTAAPKGGDVEGGRSPEQAAAAEEQGAGSGDEPAES